MSPYKGSSKAGPSRVSASREAGLIAAARDGDKKALAELTDLHLPLVRRLAYRHFVPGGSDDLDDLIQVGMVGLIESVGRFDSAQGRFAPYAAATVSGTIKRHFRDRGWRLHIPRSLHDAAQRVGSATAELESRLGRMPTDAELEEETSLPLERIVEARAMLGAAQPLSLQAPTGEGGGALDESLGAGDENFERAERRLMLGSLTDDLEDRDREVLTRRFGLDRTQTEIAGEIGVSQMQVSRVLSRVIGTLRGRATEAERSAEDELV